MRIHVKGEDRVGGPRDMTIRGILENSGGELLGLHAAPPGEDSGLIHLEYDVPADRMAFCAAQLSEHGVDWEEKPHELAQAPAGADLHFDGDAEPDGPVGG